MPDGGTIRTEALHAEERLERAIGPWAVGANAVNLSLGAGIFALPAAVAAILGPAAILAYLVCGLAIALVLMCFAELGSRVTRSGGAVAYIEAAFGPLAGFLAWAVFSVGYSVASDAAVAVVLMDAAATVVPALTHGVWRLAAFVGLFTALAAVNIIGVRQGARLAVAVTAVKLVPLVALIAAGALVLHWRALQWTTGPSIAKVGEASLLLFFAYAGAESALTPSGEIHRPTRTVPRAMLGATATLVLLYVSIQAVSQGVLGSAITEQSGAPLAAVADRLFGSTGRTLILACTIVATLGLLAGDILGTPRAFLAMAEDGLLPSALVSIHPRFHTPHVAIATSAALICVFAASGAFAPLAVLASISLLAVYLAVCVAVLQLRATTPPVMGAFRTPGGPLVPVAGALVVSWLLAQSTMKEAIGLATAIGLAAAYYTLRVRLVSALRER